MPCFLFTYHAHGTWLPDRPEGYVHWREGLQPTDERLAKAYRAKMNVLEAEFDEPLQRLLIDEVQIAAGFQRFRVHSIATEPTHLHALVSWPDERTPQHMSDGIKKSLSRRLRTERDNRKWLAKGGSERRVKDREHFDYLMKVYLPSHGGWKWDEGRGLYR